MNPPSPRLRRTGRRDESGPYRRGCPDRRHRDCDKCGGVSIRSQRRGHPRTWDWGGNGLIPVRTSTEHRRDHTRSASNGGGATPAPMWKGCQVLARVRGPLSPVPLPATAGRGGNNVMGPGSRGGSRFLPPSLGELWQGKRFALGYHRAAPSGLRFGDDPSGIGCAISRGKAPVG